MASRQIRKPASVIITLKLSEEEAHALTDAIAGIVPSMTQTWTVPDTDEEMERIDILERIKYRIHNRLREKNMAAVLRDAMHNAVRAIKGAQQ